MNLASSGQRLLAGLESRARGRRRLKLPVVHDVWAEGFPELVGAADARERLRDALQALADAGRVRLPSSPRLWDRALRPPLPLWVELPRVESEAVPTRRPEDVPWAPELVWVASARRISNLDELLAIQAFLASGGRSRPIVPLRERSLELFGDEKRLDALCKTKPFQDGRLSLDLLRCRRLAPPLVWEVALAGAGRPLLVVENLHTWESFRQWNAGVGRYAAVVYGAGEQVVGSASWLPEVRRSSQASDETRYFGDLDPRGLDIAARLAAVMKREALGPVRPAERWYRALLDHAAARPGSIGGQERALEAGFAWLGEPMGGRVRAMFERGERLAQEWVGTELLGQQVDSESA
jgi:hypothetical protein